MKYWTVGSVPNRSPCSTAMRSVPPRWVASGGSVVAHVAPSADVATPLGWPVILDVDVTLFGCAGSILLKVSEPSLATHTALELALIALGLPPTGTVSVVLATLGSTRTTVLSSRSATQTD